DPDAPAEIDQADDLAVAGQAEVTGDAIAQADDFRAERETPEKDGDRGELVLEKPEEEESAALGQDGEGADQGGVHPVDEHAAEQPGQERGDAEAADQRG